MITFKNWLKIRLDEKESGPWEAERQRFLGTYTGENEKKALVVVEREWGSLSNFLHDDDESKWSKVWAAVRGSQGA